MPTMIQIIWQLPDNPYTVAFRHSCVEDLCRMHGGGWAGFQARFNSTFSNEREQESPI